ncbi:MAG: DUF4271 domain-containing protein [Flavobacteriaceae bacterium]|nr:DUF4271 domain-containing protein [Flavobacteriaceae bacterium]
MFREIISNEWFTILIVFSLCILAFAKYAFSNRFNDYLWVIGNSKYLKIYAREQKFIDQFDSLLFVNLVISLSIFSIIGYNTLVEPLSFDLPLFIKVFVGIGAIILIKILLERLIGSLFDIDTLIDSYLFQKTNYKNYVGLILLPINIVLIFALKPNTTIIYIVFGLIVVVNIIGFITSVKTHQKTILNNLFYFILYLCALEIAPYIVLYKLFLNN